MGNLFVMAWRNLWRNKRRTLITVASVFFGVMLSTLMSSVQEGTYSSMIDNVVKMYTGYIQIQNPKYKENKTINNTFTISQDSLNQIIKSQYVTQIAPRLESFALMSFEDKTKGGALIGIDPAREQEVTNLSRWIIKGNYLNEDDDGILLADNLARNLHLQPGDTLVLLSQGYHGVSAAGLFPVRGVLKFPNPQLNNFGGYVTLKSAQAFFSAPSRLTSLVVMVDDYSNVNQANHHLEKMLEPKYATHTWKELQPQLVQMIQSDRAQGVIFKAILYMVIGFGILGTIIMMVAERWKEFGVMVAVGMRKTKLAWVMVFETILMGFTGVLAGFMVSVPVIAFLVKNPIPLSGQTAEVYEKFGIEPLILFDNRVTVFSNQLITIFILSVLVSFYPAIRILTMKAIQAIRS